MKTITINRETLKISASEERALEILQRRGFAARLSDFEEGAGRYTHSILPRTTRRAIYKDGEFIGLGQPRGHALGITKEERGNTKTKRAEAFFARHPRPTYVVIGDKRRINIILKKLQS